MTDPGLTNRLRQHSRRSGFMVGLTMALTIAICILGFTWIFIQLEPYVSDFVHRDPASSQEQNAPEQSADAQEPQQQEAEAQPTEEEQSQEPPPERPEPTSTPTPKPQPTATSAAFTPDYQLISSEQVNLRSGPGVSYESIRTVSLAEPLQYLGESEETQDPVNDLMEPGQVWMKFRTENGDEGWIREFDVEPYSE